MNIEKIDFNKKIVLKLHNAKKDIESKIHELTYLFWECTLNCNLSCIHCGSDCVKSTNAKDMPKDDFLKILDDIEHYVDKNKFIIAISGGEPLMRPDLIEACTLIKEKGFRWGMVTNGYNLTPSVFNKLLAAGLKSLTISLDGLEDDHNWFRGNRKSFERAVNAIKLAIKASEKGLIFDIVTCVNKRNIKRIEELKEFLIDLGLRRWRLGTVFPKGRAKDNDELKISGEQLKELLQFIEETREEGDIFPSYGCESFLGNYEMRVRDFPFYCKAGVNIGSVLADGSISACPSLRGDYIQGNIYSDDFIDVWENRFDVMRNRKWAKTGVCKSCKVWKYCKGNSLHLRDEKSKELLYCSYEELRGH